MNNWTLKTVFLLAVAAGLPACAASQDDEEQAAIPDGKADQGNKGIRTLTEGPDSHATYVWLNQACSALTQESCRPSTGFAVMELSRADQYVYFEKKTFADQVLTEKFSGPYKYNDFAILLSVGSR